MIELSNDTNLSLTVFSMERESQDLRLFLEGGLEQPSSADSCLIALLLGISFRGMSRLLSSTIEAVLIKELCVDCLLTDMGLSFPLGIALAPVAHSGIVDCDVNFLQSTCV